MAVVVLLSCCLLRQPASFTAQPTNEKFQDPLASYFFQFLAILTNFSNHWCTHPLKKNHQKWLKIEKKMEKLTYYSITILGLLQISKSKLSEEPIKSDLVLMEPHLHPEPVIRTVKVHQTPN